MIKIKMLDNVHKKLLMSFDKNNLIVSCIFKCINIDNKQIHKIYKNFKFLFLKFKNVSFINFNMVEKFNNYS